ncbi:sphingosine hydroxylase [Mycena latifolia]|nr:sphingosine hydroxylase [Mycena latifolia]
MGSRNPMNASACAHFFDGVCNQTADVPWYYSYKPFLVDGVSDHHLALATPVLAYWLLSLAFHYLDTRDWKILAQHRIHGSPEISSRSRVSGTAVIWAVIFQQILQTALGLICLGNDQENEHTHTWQYFLHRCMHTNKCLYRHIHSWHHRLYVPYAFGALYNHPVEGFLLDSLGTVIAVSLSGSSTRQSALLFAITTLKTVDDHYDVNADYHDIHHQKIGIKSNFAQPFFVHWDTLLGTQLTREEVELRRRRMKDKVE